MDLAGEKCLCVLYPVSALFAQQNCNSFSLSLQEPVVSTRQSRVGLRIVTFLLEYLGFIEKSPGEGLI